MLFRSVVDIARDVTPVSSLFLPPYRRRSLHFSTFREVDERRGDARGDSALAEGSLSGESADGGGGSPPHPRFVPYPPYSYGFFPYRRLEVSAATSTDGRVRVSPVNRASVLACSCCTPARCFPCRRLEVFVAKSSTLGLGFVRRIARWR